MSARSLSRTLERLYHRKLHGIKLGLEAMESLCDALDRPQERFDSIHVAGTNGKGSVCAMVESILRASGCRTGLYTSPHLVRFNERIRVAGTAVSDRELEEGIRLVEQADKVAASSPGGRPATFFEFSTALAFEHFRRASVDMAVLETGLGGRLDATNVVTPQLSVITTIGLDHTRYLGMSLPEVAYEKAGIIKPGIPVVIGAVDGEARETLERVAAERGSRYTEAAASVSIRRLEHTILGQKVKIESDRAGYPPIWLPLMGDYQLQNCATAVAAVEYLADTGRVAVDAEGVRNGLEQVRWPGRCQVLSDDPLTVLDAAHNPSGAKALLEALQTVLEDRPLGMVVSFSRDKNCGGTLEVWCRALSKCWMVVMKNERGMSREDLRAGMRDAGVEAEETSLETALAEARSWASACGGVVAIAGSIYLAGEVLELMDQGHLFE